MWIYLMCFVISTICIYCGEKAYNKSFKYASFFFGVMILAVVAGCRDQVVGTDVMVYGVRFYNLAHSSVSIKDLFQRLTISGEASDYAFHLLNFALTRAFKDYHIGLFAYSFLTFSFFLKGCMEYKKMNGDSVAFRMLLVCFLFYNTSLNAMRQLIAVAIVYCATAYLLQDRYKLFSVLAVLACSFHSSGLISLVIFGCHLILKDNRNYSEKKRFIRASIFLLISGCIVLFINQIIKYFVTLGILRSSYLNYISSGKYGGSGGLALFNIIGPTIICASSSFLFYRFHRADKKRSNKIFFTMMTVILLVMSFSTIISNYFLRVSYYFTPLAYECQIINRKYFEEKSRVIWKVIMILLAVVPWMHDIVQLNYGETIPYVFFRN